MMYRILLTLKKIDKNKSVLYLIQCCICNKQNITQPSLCTKLELKIRAINTTNIVVITYF